MIVRDSKGQILFHTVKAGNSIKVYDKHNRLLGFCADGKTRKSNGELLSHSESPGLLVEAVDWRTENPRVGSSILSLGTINSSNINLLLDFEK